MFPRFPLGDGSVSTYYVALLGGVIFGWITYMLDEDTLWTANNPMGRLRVFLTTTLSYSIIVVCCTQGAVYFHFLFDNIPESIWRRLTIKDVILANPLDTSKVLYGAIFFFPLGILIISLWNIRDRFIPLLNRKAFILFIVLGFARVGCFCHGCCYGIQSNLFGVRFPMGSVAAWEHRHQGLTHGFMAPPSLPVIPTQAISAVVLFGLAFFAFRKGQKESGPVFMPFVLYYAIFRFVIEFIRDDLERAYFGALSASQWISVAVFVLFALWTTVRRRGLHAP